ncbi:MAG: hypothetical protein ISS55_11170 [Dehalococcoidales bacterium]|nr:hypothetical protein [Dehalococcoidales bacterium]
MISSLDVFRPGTGWLVPLEDRLALMDGDVLRVNIAVPYRGPEAEFTLYGSIGQRGFFGFDEILSARATLSCPDSPEKYTTVTGELDIEIIGAGMAGIGGISGGNDYDLYVKIEEKPEVIVEIDDVIDIAGESGGSDLTGMLGMMMPLMMMGMVMPMVSEGTEE